MPIESELKSIDTIENKLKSIESKLKSIESKSQLKVN